MIDLSISCAATCDAVWACCSSQDSVIGIRLVPDAAGGCCEEPAERRPCARLQLCRRAELGGAAAIGRSAGSGTAAETAGANQRPIPGIGSTAFSSLCTSLCRDSLVLVHPRMHLQVHILSTAQMNRWALSTISLPCPILLGEADA